MRRQDSISGRGHMDNHIFLTSLMSVLAVYEWGHALKKVFLTSLMFLLILSIMPLTAVSPSLAEIYRWKDDKGVVRYSNAPPKDEETDVLDVLPTHRVPIVENANGTAYYLNVPDSDLTQEMSSQDVLEQLSLPSDVLDELMEGTSSKATAAEAEPLSTVTFRLAELEEALKREVTTRLEWEQEYLKSQSHSKELAQRNELLQLAQEAQEQQIDGLEAKLQQLDSVKRRYEQSMQALSTKLETLEASMETFDRSALMAKIDALTERVATFEQQPQDDTIHVKLAALETAMTTLTDAVPASRNTSTLVAELLESRDFFETMSEAQAEQLNWQRIQITMLRGELEQLKASENVPQTVEQAVSAVEPEVLEALAEQNTQMETAALQQAGVLALQQERIFAIEGKLEQALMRNAAPHASSASIGERQSQGSSNGRISVVERQYRRDAKRSSHLGLFINK